MEKQRYEEEISLKELILVLVNNWVIIAAITVIIAILGGIYAFGIASPTYQSRIDGTISIPESVETKYGSYPFPTTSPMDYLSVAQSERVLRQTLERLNLETSVDGLRDRFSIDRDGNSIHYSFRVTAGTPEGAKELLETIAEEFIEEVNLLYKERAVDYFISELSVLAESLDEDEIRYTQELENAEALIETMEPRVTLRKLILDDPLYAANLAEQRNININELSEEMMLEEMVNPIYATQEREIFDLMNQLNAIEIHRERNIRLRAELQEEDEKLMEYRRSEGNDMTEGLLEVLRSPLRINEEATMPQSPTDPNKQLILAISIVLGLMLGVFVAFFKAYWHNEMNTETS